MAYDKRITDLAAIAALAAAKNAQTAPQLLLGHIAFALADAVKDGRIILGRPGSVEAAPALPDPGYEIEASVEEVVQVLKPMWSGEGMRVHYLEEGARKALHHFANAVGFRASAPIAKACGEQA